MSPAKISKKKRAGGATTGTLNAARAYSGHQSPRFASASAVSHSVKDQASLREACAYFDTLLFDNKALAFRLDGIMWLHQIVATVIINVAMYDLEVRSSQLFASLWSCLWLGRRFILHHALRTDPHHASWKQYLAWRLVALCGFAAAAFALNSEAQVWTHAGSNMHISTVAILDISGIATSLFVPSRIVAKLVDLADTVFTIAYFSTQYNQRPYLIYDQRTIALTVVTVVVHSIIVDRVRHTLLISPWNNDTEVHRSQQQRRKAVEEARRLLAEETLSKPPPVQSHGPTDDSVELNGASVATFRASLAWLSVAAITMCGDSRGQLALWTAAQAVFVLVQAACAVWVVYAWELWSIVMVTSVHLLLEMMRLRRQVSRSPTWLSQHA